MDFAPILPEHQIEWAELIATCFDRKCGEMMALFAWLHQMGDVVAWGAWDGDKLIAQYTSLMRQLSFNHQSLVAGMSVNMAVHPDYRGRGLIKQVSAPVYEEILACGAAMGLGFSNAEGVKVDRNSKSYAYQVVGQMQSLISCLPNRPSAKLELFDRLPSDLLFAHEIQTSNLVRFKKTAQSFLTRYGGHPFRDYQYGIYYENHEVQGIVVYREINYWGVWGASLMDAYGADLPELIQRWGSTISSHGMRFIHTLASPASEIVSALRRNYRTHPLPYTRTPYYLTVRPLSHDFDIPIENFRLWDFIGGDIL